MKEGTVVEQRTFGGIEVRADAWLKAGSKKTTAWTSKLCEDGDCVGGKRHTPDNSAGQVCSTNSALSAGHKQYAWTSLGEDLGAGGPLELPEGGGQCGASFLPRQGRSS